MRNILNWAFKYDAEGEISGLWNASVYNNQGEEYVIKNSGWNYEIAPGQTVNFGYTLLGDDLATPEKFELCSKRTEVASGYETSLNVVDRWDTGMKAEFSITNTSDEPIEAWELSFDTNFTIDNLWDGRIPIMTVCPTERRSNSELIPAMSIQMATDCPIMMNSTNTIPIR